MTITLSDNAAEHVKKYLARQDMAKALRVSVRATGCSGFSYVVDTADEFNEDDQLFESHGIQIVVDSNSFKYLKGTEIDYSREGLNEGFRFNNPNVAETCGCGESFTIE